MIRPEYELSVYQVNIAPGVALSLVVFVGHGELRALLERERVCENPDGAVPVMIPSDDRRVCRKPYPSAQRKLKIEDEAVHLPGPRSPGRASRFDTRLIAGLKVYVLEKQRGAQGLPL